MKTVAEVFEACREPNWDGYGSQAMSESARDWALDFEKLLPPEFPDPNWVPASNGWIQVEWEFPNRRDFLTIEIDSDGTCNYEYHLGTSSAVGALTPKPRFTKFPKTFQDILTAIYRRK